MNKIYTFLLCLFLSFSIHSVEDIDKLMVEKAQTPEEKKAIYKYLMGEAKEKQQLAKRLRDMAGVSRGGKAASQSSHKKEMLEEAESLENDAKEYEALAQKVKP